LTRQPLPETLRWLLVAFGLSGFSAMAYEVAWTRALSLIVGSSTYAFCLMLATFLGGMALGSFLARWRLKRSAATLRQVVYLEMALWGYGLLSILLFSHLPGWLVALWPVVGESFAGLSWLQVVLSGSVMLLPTVCLGALFPIVSELITRRLPQLGERLGVVYAVNTLGGIAGSFLSGFALIPTLGLAWAIAVAALANFLAATVVFLGAAREGLSGRVVLRRAAVSAVGLGLALAASGLAIVPAWQQEVLATGVYLDPGRFRGQPLAQAAGSMELLYYRDSLNTTVSVHRQGETLFLKVGGKTDASTGLDMATQVLSAHLPLLLHPEPQRVLVVGLGSGVTLGRAGRHPVSLLHCAELDPAVIEGARHFAAYNDRVHDDPRARIFAVDGRNFLLAAEQRYDVITSEPSNPWISGVGYLFTQEFFELARRRLSPGGIMCQWLQLYGIFPGDVKLVLKTFHEVFPSVSVWASLPGDLLLIGSVEPHQTTSRQLAQRMAEARIADSLREVQVDRPELLLALFQLGTREVEELTADVERVHRDDQPLVEFNAPKALYVGPVASLNYTGIARFQGDVRSVVADDEPADRDAAFYQALARLWRFREELDKAQAALEQAVALEPGAAEAWRQLAEVALARQQPLRAEAALARLIERDPEELEARRRLARLYWQQGRLEDARLLYERVARMGPPGAELAEELGRFLAALAAQGTAEPTEGQGALTTERTAKQDEWVEQDDVAEQDRLAAAGTGDLDWQLAAEYLRSALSQRWDSRSEVLLAYAEALRRLRAWEAAEQVLRAGVSAFPEERQFPLLLGDLLLDQERWLEAEPWFRRVVQLTPDSGAASYGLGRIAAKLGRREEAMRWLRQAAHHQPYHRQALRRLHRLQSTPAPTDARASRRAPPS
jgi:spermidine synthase